LRGPIYLIQIGKLITKSLSPINKSKLCLSARIII
jgi:hypothetical protein